ncbi:MAG: cation transporter, partial [Thiobacillus sp.]|nr:cation transporter [Thiobacillus sp.]
MHDHKHGHAHAAHEHHEHAHSGHNGALLVALLLTLAFAGVEALAGWWSGSLALLSDAAHMLTDSSALGLAAAAAGGGRRPARRRAYDGLA